MCKHSKTLLILALLISFSLTGCIPIPKGTRKYYTEPHPFARTNNSGQTNEFITETRTEYKSFLLLAPHGPELDYTFRITCRYHLHRVDTKPIALDFLTSHRPYTWMIFAIRDTSRWLAVGGDDEVKESTKAKMQDYGEGYYTHKVLIFDERHVLHEAVIKVHRIPRDASGATLVRGEEVRFDSTGESLTFKDKSGWRALNLLTGEVSTL